VTACLLILAPAAAVLAAGLLTAGIVVPLAGAAVARRAARAAAPARGRLAATVTDLLDGAADLHAFGAADAALAHADAMDAELTRTDARTAAASALGARLLARAFLADPALLILDEPTAHLDPATRQALTNDLLNATEGRSVLLITHELDGLDPVDHIVVLDHGKIAEQGTHQQLRRAGGSYQRMWEGGSDLPASLRSPLIGEDLVHRLGPRGDDRPDLVAVDRLGDVR
jgi:ABC-type multidrug transport system fused ATPase/permease subunit